VVTSTLVMEGDGRVGDYVGGYSDWLRQRPAADAARTPAATAPATAAAAPAAPAAAAPAKRKLSFKEARELEQLPGRIDALEAKLAQLAEAMNEPAFYQRDSATMAAHTQDMATAQAELEQAYARWQALDS